VKGLHDVNWYISDSTNSYVNSQSISSRIGYSQYPFSPKVFIAALKKDPTTTFPGAFRELLFTADYKTLA
jgi:hypothetical protein